MEEGTVPANWADLAKYSSELATRQDYQLAETWLSQSSSNNTDSSPADNPAVDPFVIVAGTDHPGSGNKNGTKRSLEILNLEVGTTDNDVANFMLANSEGEHSSGKITNPLSRKHNQYPAGNVCASAHGSKIGGMGGRN